MWLCQELPDFVGGDGEGDSCRDLQRVDADHLSILQVTHRRKGSSGRHPLHPAVMVKVCYCHTDFYQTQEAGRHPAITISCLGLFANC